MPQPLPAATAEDLAFASLIAYAHAQWPGYRDAAHHRLIARKLEAVERGEITRLMIFMPPRHGKSMLASEFFPAWYLGRNPSHYIIAATYAQDLADDFGRKVRNQIADPLYQAIFPGVSLKTDSTSAKRFNVSAPEDSFSIEQDGAYFAVGVGGPLTGRGAHLLLIDDPVKNREEAESEVIRRKTKDWYTSTAYTRLMPGGRIVVIQCMTGDTSVLMADGTGKALRNVRVGDEVATYDNGRVAVSKVLNWKNQGPDDIYKIRMKSGAIAKANERHPFLVEQGGRTEWQRTGTLKPGQKILRVIGANGAVSNANQSIAKSPQNAAGSVCRIIKKIVGQTDFDHRLQILFHGARRICDTAMELIFKSMKHCWPRKAESALFAANHLPAKTRAHIGPANYASITATTPAKRVGFSVTTATLQSDMEKRPKHLSPPLATCDITLDEIASVEFCGREEVFDIEVERTENFIANGLVSHNTRWHEDDLSGWQIREHQDEGWDVLSLPAISDDGKALWPSQYSVETLEKIRRNLGPRDWSALYQQSPSPEDGTYFLKEWFTPVDSHPPLEVLRVYGASDYAVTDNGGDYTVHIVIGIDPAGRMWLLDLWRKQATADVWIDAWCDLVKQWKPSQWAEESGQINASVGPFLSRRALETGASTWRRQFPSRHDKAIRARSIQGRLAMQGLMVPRDAPWLADFLSELMSFPNGKNDDQADALGLFGQLLDLISKGEPPKAEKVAPKDLQYQVTPTGVIQGNATVREAVEAMIRRKKQQN